MIPTRQGVLYWTIPSQPQLPPASQRRQRELLSHMLLAATAHNLATVGNAASTKSSLILFRNVRYTSHHSLRTSDDEDALVCRQPDSRLKHVDLIESPYISGCRVQTHQVTPRRSRSHDNFSFDIRLIYQKR